ncbi:protein wntless isoform X2 [Phymastichus coffea]|uniref:protein wntless isoform X2 n=1 Tax=Phymastichus coffea TaxID=108790 RepID=UPI00273AAECC|nr:protein wntless isoform X2 [Phymastichus coffea]
MQGTIIENLSSKKLSMLVALLLIGQLVSFLIGGLVAPPPSNSQNILGIACVDVPTVNGTPPGLDTWIYFRPPGKCQIFETHHMTEKIVPIVYTFQMPRPYDNKILDYSRWQHSLIGVLQVDIMYHNHIAVSPTTKLTLDARLAYRNKNDQEDQWKHYASSVVERNLDCTIDKRHEEYNYNCSTLSLFELGSLHHDYYLLNIRLPNDPRKQVNQDLGHVTDLWLTVINQNGGFTKVWVSLKTVFFPITLLILCWYWRRIHMLSRSPALLEYVLLGLGCALSFLNMPLEYLTLAFDMPFMLLLEDIRQGVFYASLLSFWFIFAGEHLMVQDGDQISSLKCYWRHLSAVGIGCLSLLFFDMCERGVQLRNPFYSIWVTSAGAKTALAFIIMAGISAGAYLLFLTYMIYKVFVNISAKRAVLPSMSSARRLHYEGVIYRFKFLMVATLLCASLTVIGFILGQVAEGQWKWDQDIELEMTSAFFTGVYGMWNIYTIALLCLYAPSHKQWPVEPSDNSVSEEIEFSRLPTEPNEMLSLTAFTRKTAID